MVTQNILNYQHSPIKSNPFFNFINLKDSFIKIINTYNNLYLNMNTVNKIIQNYSEHELINIKLLNEPINLVNKDISQTKFLIEKYFKILNENINNISLPQGKSTNVKIFEYYKNKIQQSTSSLILYDTNTENQNNFAQKILETNKYKKSEESLNKEMNKLEKLTLVYFI